MATAILLGFAGGVSAADKTGPPENDLTTQPIEITADRLVSHGNQNYAEFIGNVEATQGNFSIRSDTLKITYQQSTQVGTKGVSSADSIEKIEAIGRVKINAENRRAETDRAEYRLKEDVVELIGDNSFVTDGKNTLTGSKISWHRKTGEINVAGSNQKRVKAVFYSTKTLAPQTQNPADGTEKASPK
ncbi:MAG: lipopolysaccharide transport periplasmic protein LptA [Desulfobacterales bacterium]